LTAIRSALVRTETLASVSKTLDFGKTLRMSKGEIASGGRGLISSRVFTEDGRLVASTAQEALLRRMRSKEERG